MVCAFAIVGQNAVPRPFGQVGNQDAKHHGQIIGKGGGLFKRAKRRKPRRPWLKLHQLQISSFEPESRSSPVRLFSPATA